MKNKQKTQLLLLTVVVLIAAVGYMFYNPQVVEVPVEVAVQYQCVQYPLVVHRSGNPNLEAPLSSSTNPDTCSRWVLSRMVRRPSLFTVKRSVVVGTATVTTPPPEVKTYTQCQSPTMRGTAWKTLGAKSYTEMKQSP